MFDKILSWAKDLFVKPEGGVNWRTLLVTGAGLAAGMTGLLGADGLLLGGAIGLGASALLQMVMPAKAEDKELKVVDAGGKKEEKGKGQGQDVYVEAPKTPQAERQQHQRT